MPVLDFSCKKENCPVFSSCCYLPTSFFDIEDKVDILFVGQGGGADEREKGRPFIGLAGKRLKTCILYAKRLWGKPFGVAFSNTIRNNPQNNRVPTKEEINVCIPYLYRDIKQLKRFHELKVIMPLGNHAKSCFVENNIGITDDRKNIYTIRNDRFGSIIVKPSLHPSYIMRHGKFNPEGFDKFLIDDILESLKRIYL